MKIEDDFELFEVKQKSVTVVEAGWYLIRGSVGMDAKRIYLEAGDTINTGDFN